MKYTVHVGNPLNRYLIKTDTVNMYSLLTTYNIKNSVFSRTMIKILKCQWHFERIFFFSISVFTYCSKNGYNAFYGQTIIIGLDDNYFVRSCPVEKSRRDNNLSTKQIICKQTD